jgi:hypothetical protein
MNFLFGLFCHIEIFQTMVPFCHFLSTIKKPLMSRGALRWFHNLEIWLLNNIVIENSVKPKIEIFMEIGAHSWNYLKTSNEVIS